MCRGQHRHDPVQRPGWRTPFQTSGETSKRLEEDSYAKFKYDATVKQDAVIINRVAELAEKRGVHDGDFPLPGCWPRLPLL